MISIETSVAKLEEMVKEDPQRAKDITISWMNQYQEDDEGGAVGNYVGTAARTFRDYGNPVGWVYNGLNYLFSGDRERVSEAQGEIDTMMDRVRAVMKTPITNTKKNKRRRDR